MLSVLVCGGRGYDNRQLVYDVLDRLRARYNGLYVIEGGARGADTLARQWRRDRRQPGLTVAANWTLGRRAGALRNQEMADLKPDLGVVFPGGSGTADMLRRLRKANVSTLQIAQDGTPTIAYEQTQIPL